MTSPLRIIALLFAFSACASFAAEKPNIIYILLDDAGYGDLSCYGQEKFQTPNIDRLATEGMKFTDHYAGSTVCAPTFSDRMIRLPEVFMVAPITRSPSRLVTGIGSPVIIDSSTELLPSVTMPSTGTFSPGLTRNKSPTCT